MTDVVPQHYRGVLRKLTETSSRINDMTVKLTNVQGKFLIQGSGEASFHVEFPVWFTDEPHFTYGVVMDTDFRVVSGNFPVHGAVVDRWDRRNISSGFPGYYAGCDLAFRTTGQADQQLWLHWKMEGKALRNPINPQAAKRLGGDV